MKCQAKCHQFIDNDYREHLEYLGDCLKFYRMYFFNAGVKEVKNVIKDKYLLVQGRPIMIYVPLALGKRYASDICT